MGPGRSPKGRVVRGGRAPDPGRPTARQEAPPPGTSCRPRSTQERVLWGCRRVPTPPPPAPTASGQRAPAARPEGGQPGKGERLTPGAPHNSRRHPPRGRASATPTARNAGPQGRTLWGRCWVPTLAPTAPGTHRSRNPGCPLQRTGGRGRDSAGHQTPLTAVAGHPPRGRPPTTPPPPPRHATPTGHAGQGDSVGPPHPHTRAHSTLVADPNSPPGGRAVGGATAPDLRRPSQWSKAPLPGTPFRHPHSEQRRSARAHAVGPVLGPHARTERSRDTRVAEPRPPAPEDGRPGRDSA